MAAQPQCPSCQAKGKEHIVGTAGDQKAPGGLAKFEIVHCEKCGYVYTVYPNFMIPG
jgi:uncharacterized Zn finger protein